MFLYAGQLSARFWGAMAPQNLALNQLVHRYILFLRHFLHPFSNELKNLLASCIHLGFGTRYGNIRRRLVTMFANILQTDTFRTDTFEEMER